MDRPFFGEIWKGLVRRQVDGPALESGGQNCSGDTWEDLILRYMGRPALETDGQTSSGDGWTDQLWGQVDKPAGLEIGGANMLWRHMRRCSLETLEETCSWKIDRPVMESDGQTCYRQRDKHAVETRWDDLYHVVNRQTNETTWVVCRFVTNRHMLCCYAVMYAFTAHTWQTTHFDRTSVYCTIQYSSCWLFFTQPRHQKRNSDLFYVQELYCTHINVICGWDILLKKWHLFTFISHPLRIIRRTYMYQAIHINIS